MLKISSPTQIGPLTVGRTSSLFCILDTRTGSQRTGFSSRKVAEECARKQLVNERNRARTEGRECGKCGRIHTTPEAAAGCSHTTTKEAPTKEAPAAPKLALTTEDVIDLGRVRLAQEFESQCAQSRRIHS